LAALERRFYYAFDPAYQYPGKPSVTAIPINSLHQFSLDGVSVNPILVDHGGLDVFGFRIGQLAYITDAKTIPEKSMEKLMGLDVLVLNALRFEAHDTHLNIAEAVDICKKLQPKQCFLTHISHDMGCHAEVNELLPPNIHLGYDGLTLNSA
jgi:phosphoribosyl 1,2-cyclic phosphate phosphodiesterase